MHTPPLASCGAGLADHHGVSVPQISKTLPLMKTKAHKKYDPLKVKLTADEQAIEEAIDENEIPETDPVLLKEDREPAARALEKIRGGRRAGAGRKSREYVKTTVLLATCRADPSRIAC
jgi:hypothetical protein